MMDHHVTTSGYQGGVILQYRLIATDIDGTLFNERQEITPRTRTVLKELQRRGAIVVLSTARPPRSIRPIHQDLGLTDPVIAYNGALVYDQLKDAPILHHTIPSLIALEVLAAIRSVDSTLNVGLEMADHWHVDRIDERIVAMLASGQVRQLPATGDVEQAIATTTRGVSKLYFRAPPAVRIAFEERMAGLGLNRQTTVTSSGREFVEIAAVDVNKGSALRAIATILGVPLANTLALGDEENDIPALQAAGLGIAMGNASDHVKRIAGGVSGSNSADGWAEAVERYVLTG